MIFSAAHRFSLTTSHGYCPSVDLAAGWLAARLGVPVTRIAVDDPSVKKQASLNVTPVERVELVRPSGATVLEALDGQTIGVSVPNQEPARMAMNLRTRTGWSRFMVPPVGVGCRG